MSNYVSDSEDEDFGLLDYTSISRRRLLRALQKIKSDDRNENVRKLKDEVNSMKDLEDPGRERQDQMCITSNVGIDKSREIQEAKNANYLRLFLDSDTVHDGSTRRGLRKRKFSSTHPYLADQASWLGLADTIHLNNLYEDTPDMETIVKYLNHVYLQKRKRYPKDEKYKAKNFYYYLGKKSIMKDTLEARKDSATRDAELEPHDLKSVDEEGQAVQSDTYFSDSDSSIEYLAPANRKTNVVSTDEEDMVPQREIPRESRFSSSDSSDISSEDEEDYIRIGGKYRKERNILKGALPESAKRLDLYNKRPSSKTKIRDEEPTPRKGLAIRKQGLKSYSINHDFSFDVINNAPQEFIDDSNYYEENTSYLNAMNDDLELQRVLSVESITSEDSLSIINEKDTRSGMTYEEDMKDIEYDDKIGHQNSNYDTQISEVLERDYIDTMKPSGGTRRHFGDKAKKSTRKTQQTRRTKQSTLNYERVSFPSYPGFKRTVYRTLNNTEGFQKTNKLKKHRRKRHLANVHPHYQEDDTLEQNHKKLKINPKEVLRDDYSFSRVPNQFTIALETESDRRFVKNHLHDSSKLHLNKLSENVFDVHNQQNDHFAVDMEKVEQLGSGDRISNEKDSLTVKLFGKMYIFTLVNRSASTEAFENLLIHLQKVMKDDSKINEYGPNEELHSALYGAVNWSLIWQESPPESIWKLSRLILYDLLQGRNKESYRQRFRYIPGFLVLFYIFVLLRRRIHQKNDESLEAEFNKMCTKFWSLFFMTFEEQDLKLQQDENDGGVTDLKSLEFFKTFFYKLRKDIWYTLNLAISRLGALGSMRKLELAFLLVNIKPYQTNQWAPFYTIYESCILEDNVEVHNFFLDIVYHLHENRAWSLEEKQIMLVYSTISNRKYANFEGEEGAHELMGKIVTRDDIPFSVFFERFMYFVYYYVSNLLDSQSKKRLMNKLFVSSQYSYKDDKIHLAMLVNRFNFILLLKQIGQIEMNNQLYDLFLQVGKSRNFTVISLALNALDTYCNLGFEKGQKIPIDSYYVLFKCISDNFSVIERSPRLWMRLLRMLEDIHSKERSSGFATLESLLQLAARFDLRGFPSNVLLDYLVFNDKVMDSFLNSKTGQQIDEKLLGDANAKIASLLHYQMGRFPLSIRQEKKTEAIIELALTIWIKLTGASINNNWNVLVLQKFPYIGNTESRKYFALYFYSVLLKFSDLKACMDRVISDLLKSLASCQLSKYVPLLWNTLKVCGSEYLPFQRYQMTEKISSLQAQNFRGTMISDIMFLITTSKKIPQTSKILHLEEFITQLNADYTDNYQFEAFVEFCKSSMKTIQLYFKEITLTNDVYRNFASKIGIISSEQNELSWLSMNFHQRLVRVHLEFVSSIHFKKDVTQQLDKYLLPDNIILLYHLLDIYMREALEGKEDRWIVLHYSVSYLLQKLQQFRIKISEATFKKILTNLAILVSYDDEINYWSQFSSLTKSSIHEILRNVYYLFDGYKDRSYIVELIDMALNEKPKEVDINAMDYECLSSLRLYDIERPNEDVTLNVLSSNISKNGSFDENTFHDISTRLESLSHNSRNTGEVLIFDL